MFFPILTLCVRRKIHMIILSALIPGHLCQKTFAKEVARSAHTDSCLFVACCVALSATNRFIDPNNMYCLLQAKYLEVGGKSAAKPMTHIKSLPSDAVRSVASVAIGPRPLVKPVATKVSNNRVYLLQGVKHIDVERLSVC